MENKRGGVYVPSFVMNDRQLSAPLKLLYAVMLDLADDVNICRASSETLAERIGITHRAINNSRLRLLQRGYLEKIEGTRNNFRFVKRKALIYVERKRVQHG